MLDWRMYLPESWTKDGKRREEAGIPKEVVFKMKWPNLSLALIGQVRTWGQPIRLGGGCRVRRNPAFAMNWKLVNSRFVVGIFSRLG